MKALRFLLLIMLFGACHQPEPREPIIKRSGHFLKESVIRNKAIQAEQENLIEEAIKRDSLHTYHSSKNGFWYAYVEQNEEASYTAEFGDLVYYEYDIYTLDGREIYSKEELGLQSYKMDQEDLFKGLRLGLKMMKEGETMIFYFPSSVAYDYYGDQDRIGRNLPIRCTVSLHSITQNKIKKKKQ